MYRFIYLLYIYVIYLSRIVAFFPSWDSNGFLRSWLTSPSPILVTKRQLPGRPRPVRPVLDLLHFTDLLPSFKDVFLRIGQGFPNQVSWHLKCRRPRTMRMLSTLLVNQRNSGKPPCFIGKSTSIFQ